MIISANELSSKEEFAKVDPIKLESKLKSLEKLIRSYTHNNFQNRAVRFIARSNGDRLFGYHPFLKAGDTIEISKSEVNDGLYVATEINPMFTIVDTELFAVPLNCVTKIEYPEDVKEGVVNMLLWEIDNRQKVGIKSESISRHSVTYYDQDANNQIMGYPVSLMGFLKPYMKARF